MSAPQPLIKLSRRLAAAVVVCASALALLAAIAAPAEAASTASGGMVRVSPGGGLLAQAGGVEENAASSVASAASSASSSCGSVTFRGDAGYIAVQTSPNGTVAWGIYMYDPANKYGHWEVDVFVGSRRVDHKSQNYEPHGSVNPSYATPGSTFHIDATMSNENGTFVNVPNECIIP